MTFDEWYETGRANGWCSPARCTMHEAMFITAEEEYEIDEGGDPCIVMMRLYDDDEQRLAVEAHDSAAVYEHHGAPASTTVHTVESSVD